MRRSFGHKCPSSRPHSTLTPPAAFRYRKPLFFFKVLPLGLGVLRFPACLLVLLLSAVVLAENVVASQNTEWPLPLERVPSIEPETLPAVEPDTLPAASLLPVLAQSWVSDEITLWVTPSPSDILPPPVWTERTITAVEVKPKPTHRLLKAFWGYRVSEESRSWTIGNRRSVW